jgi:hypothetical protein
MRPMSEFMPTCRANFGDLLQESRFYTVWTKSSLSDVHLLAVIEDSRSRTPNGADVFAANVGTVVAPDTLSGAVGPGMDFLVQQLTALMS